MPPAPAKPPPKPCWKRPAESLAGRFQVRLYRFGKEPERIPKPDALNPTEPATRIGDTLERVLAESSSLPLGAIVLLSDGADNSGGIDLATIAAIRRQRIPVHTIGFGQEHPDRDVEITDAVVAPRALPQSRLTAVVTCRATAFRARKAKLSVRDSGKVLAVAGRHVEGRWRSRRPNRWSFNVRRAGAEDARIGVDPLPGEENTANNNAWPAWSTSKIASRASSISTASRAGSTSSSAARWQIIPTSASNWPAIVRTTENKILHQLDSRPAWRRHDLADGFPAKAEELFAFQAVIIGSDGGQLFHRHPAAVDPRFRGPARRRAAVHRAAGTRFPMAAINRRRWPIWCRPSCRRQRARFTAISDRRGTDAAGRAERASAGWTTTRRRNLDALEEDSADGRLPGSGRSQARRHRAAGIDARRASAPQPLLVTENYGRGRTAADGHRRKLALENVAADHDDHTQATFWQQLIRYLVTDTPGQVTAIHAQAGAVRRHPRADSRGSARQAVTSRWPTPKCRRASPGRMAQCATLELTPAAARRGNLHGRMDGRKAGIVRGGNHRRARAGRDWAATC